MLDGTHTSSPSTTVFFTHAEKREVLHPRLERSRCRPHLCLPRLPLSGAARLHGHVHVAGRGEAGLELELVPLGELYMMWRHSDVVDVQVEVLALRSAGEREWEAMEETPGRVVFVGSVASAVVMIADLIAAGDQ